MSESRTPNASVARDKVPFPRVFWVAIGLEVLERMAFYGVYINLTVYLGQSVGLSDKELSLIHI